MQVTLRLQGGPMAGQHKEIDLLHGKVLLGRDPGPGGFLLDGDVTVSRRHGELHLDHSQIVFTNLSANGTDLDGTLCMGRQPLTPGAVLKLGRHEIEVHYDSPSAKHRPAAATSSESPGSLWNTGPLAKPAVRAVLVVYLLGLLALAFYLATSEGNSTSAAWRQTRTEYAGHYLKTLPQEAGAERLRRADQLVGELEAHLKTQRFDLARHLCHELMALDADPHSPLYRFAARRLGDLAGRR